MLIHGHFDVRAKWNGQALWLYDPAVWPEDTRNPKDSPYWPWLARVEHPDNGELWIVDFLSTWPWDSCILHPGLKGWIIHDTAFMGNSRFGNETARQELEDAAVLVAMQPVECLGCEGHGVNWHFGESTCTACCGRGGWYERKPGMVDHYKCGTCGENRPEAALGSCPGCQDWTCPSCLPPDFACADCDVPLCTDCQVRGHSCCDGCEAIRRQRAADEDFERRYELRMRYA